VAVLRRGELMDGAVADAILRGELGSSPRGDAGGENLIFRGDLAVAGGVPFSAAATSIEIAGPLNLVGDFGPWFATVAILEQLTV